MIQSSCKTAGRKCMREGIIMTNVKLSQVYFYSTFLQIAIDKKANTNQNKSLHCHNSL